MFNRDLFRAKIVERGKTMRDVAVAIGCSEATLSRKVNGISDFTRNEIQLFRQSFCLSSEEVEHIFFALHLRKRKYASRNQNGGERIAIP